MIALSVSGLKKTYGNRVHALKGIDFKVEKGDFFALLGPNGAGKSTAISIISSLVNKTRGKVLVFGHDLDKENEKTKRCIGLVPQEFNFSIFEKLIDIVTQQAGYYGIDLRTATKRADRFFRRFGLDDKRNMAAQTLSGGMKRKLMIARALVHNPMLLILDEPTAGVDVETRREMWEFLSELNKKGTTIILTTHYLEEAEQLCRNIAIIDHGRIIQNSSIKSLLSTLHIQTFVLDIKEPVKEIAPIKDYDIRMRDDTTIEVDVKQDQDINQLMLQLDSQNVRVMSMRNKSNRLEELFMRLTKR